MASNNIRTELLIVLEYLLKKTDENHHAFQSDIVKYAEDEYDVIIDRRNVGSCLEYLYDISSRYPDKFPFILESVDTGVRCKYYADQRPIDVDSLAEICSALINDKYTSEERTQDLVNSLIEMNASEYEQEQLKNKFISNNLKVAKISEDSSNTIQRIAEAIDDKEMLIVEVKDMWDIKYASRKGIKGKEQDISQIHDASGLFRVYPYALKEFNNEIYAICGDVEHRTLLTIPADEITIKKNIQMGEDAPTLRELLTEFKYHDIDDFFLKVIAPGSGEEIDIEFKVNELNSHDISTRVARSFKRHFNQELKYEIKPIQLEMNPVISGTDKFDTSKKKKITLFEHIAKIKMGQDSFLEWASNIFILRDIEITSPNSLKEYLSNELTRLAKKNKS